MKEVGVRAPVAPRVKLQACRVAGAGWGSKFQWDKEEEATLNPNPVAMVVVTLFWVT